MQKRKWALCARTLILMLPALLFGQSERGTISGLVKDPSGAVVPNAKVTVTNTETAFRSETVTSSDGNYYVPYLSPGSYRIEIEVQDPKNRSHVDRWRYGVVNYLQIIKLKRLSGPQAVDLALIDPDLEANLFDLDAIDLSATPRLIGEAISRARLQDAAGVTRMDIKRQTFILPKPTSGDVRWSLRVESGREHAEVFANYQGVIVGLDLSGTQRAKTLNLLKQPELVVEAAAAFRAAVGVEPVLTTVRVSEKTVSFGTNIPERVNVIPGMPATSSFTWDLNGLQQRLGAIDVNAQMGTQRPPPFSVDDVKWAILAKLEQDALAKVATPHAAVSRVGVAKSSEGPGGAVFAWTVEITDPGGEVTSVVADVSGAIVRVVLPKSLRPKADWLAPATIADAIRRVGTIFGPDAKIASIVFEDQRARITVDDPANGGRPATFAFTADTLIRAAISFSLDSLGPRFSVRDLAPLTESKFAALEADALKRLGAQKMVYLESVTIGSSVFVSSAGGHAIEIRVRDAAVDSVSAHYFWVVYDFNGRVLDFVTP
jgi:hypothetical protein